MKLTRLWVAICALCLVALLGCQQQMPEEPISTMPAQVIVETPAPPPPPVRVNTPLPEVPVPEGAGLYVINEGVDGYINVQGKVVITPGIYASMAPVADVDWTQEDAWRAPVSLRLLAVARAPLDGAGSSGFALVNATGEVKTDFIYMDFTAGRNGVVFARKEDNFIVPLLERDGTPLMPGEYTKAVMVEDTLVLLAESGLVLANAQGEVVASVEGIEMFSTPGEGLLPVQDASGAWGYVNLESGQMAIEPQFSWALGFAEGMGCVGFMDGGAGYIGADGERRIREAFHTARPFRDGMAVVRRLDDNGEPLSYIIDALGKSRNETGFDTLADFVAGNTFTVGSRFEHFGKDGQVGVSRYSLLARDGTETALSPNTTAVSALAADRYLISVMVEEEARMGLMDGQCNWLLRPETYVSIKTTQYPLHLLALAQGEDAKWQLLNLNAHEIMGGFDALFSSDGRLIYCRKDGKTGYMDFSGEWVYPPPSDELGMAL